MKAKAFWKSKTILFNILNAAVIGAVGSMSDQQVVTPEAATAWTTILNIFLRSITKDPVGMSDG